MERECPTGCRRPVMVGKLMCGPCWSHVPPHIQSAVYRTWRAWRSDRADAEKFRAYSEASDAAIAAVP